jgi:hypothetical protein
MKAHIGLNAWRANGTVMMNTAVEIRTTRKANRRSFRPGRTVEGNGGVAAPCVVSAGAGTTDSTSAWDEVEGFDATMEDPIRFSNTVEHDGGTEVSFA